MTVRTDIDDAIDSISSGRVLRHRLSRGTLRKVLHVGDFVVKEFDIPKGRKLLRRPWQLECEALHKLEGLSDDQVPVVRERAGGDGGREVFLVKRFVEGTAIDAFSPSDMPALAELLAEIHAAGVVTDDADIGNFIRTPAGKLACIDFGRAVVFRHGPAPFFAVGREFAKLYREGFFFDRTLMDAFLLDYFSLTHASYMRRVLVVAVGRATIALRAMRKGRGR